MEEKEMINLSASNSEGRRDFIKKAGIGTAGILAARVALKGVQGVDDDQRAQ